MAAYLLGEQEQDETLMVILHSWLAGQVLAMLKRRSLLIPGRQKSDRFFFFFFFFFFLFLGRGKGCGKLVFRFCESCSFITYEASDSRTGIDAVMYLIGGVLLVLLFGAWEVVERERAWRY